METNPHTRFIQFRYWFHQFAVASTWTLMVISVVTVLLRDWIRSAAELSGRVPHLDRSLLRSFVITWVVIALLWVALSCFHHRIFRNLMWDAARAVGRVQRWLSSGWRIVVLLFLGAFAFQWWRNQLLGHPIKWVEFLSWDMMLQVLAATSLFAGALAIYRARRRIIILSFTDYSGSALSKGSVEGLAARLRAELARTVDLCRSIDETSPAKAKEGAVEASITVPDIGSSLGDAVSATSTVKLGPIAMPIGAVFAGLARLAQGPRLSCSIHLDGEQLVLLARLSGGGKSGSWQTETFTKGGAASKQLSAMLDELAIRIFTDVAPVGSPRWRAVRHYTRALRRYREAQGNAAELKPFLREAEREFLCALSEDNDFAQCHYNLGVVYAQLGEFASAINAYEAALKKDPNQWDACYAIALRRYHAKDYFGCMAYCERAIHICPEDSRAWDLKSLALRFQAKALEGAKEPVHQAEAKEAKRVVVDLREIATALAWRRLCTQALTSPEPDARMRNAAVNATRNLGIAIAHAGRHARAIRLLRQALRLHPDDPELLLELGKIAENHGEHTEAIEALTRLSPDTLSWNDGLDRGETLIQAALAFVPPWSSNKVDLIQNTGRELLEAIALSDEKAWEKGEIALPRVAKGLRAKIAATETQAGPITAHLEVLEHLATDLESAALTRRSMERNHDETPQEHLERLKGQRGGLTPADSRWAMGLVEYHLGLVNRELEVFERAETHLRLALAALESTHSNMVGGLGIYGELARVHAARNQLDSALQSAERSVALRPQRAWERSRLADVLWAMRDYAGAEREWQTALSLAPDLDLLGAIAGSHWNRGLQQRTHESRTESFNQILRIYRQILRWIDSETTRVGTESNDAQERTRFELRAYYNYWLGQFFRELLDFNQAIGHVQVAVGMGYKPHECKLVLGQIYLEARAFEDAERILREVLQHAPRSGTRPEPAQKDKFFSDGTPEEELWAETFLTWSSLHSEPGRNRDLAGRALRAAQRQIQKCKLAPRRRLLGLYHERQAALHRLEGHSDKAVKMLELAVRANPTASAYLALAELWLQVSCMTAAEERARCHQLKLALAAVRHIDLRGEFRERLATMQDRLDELEKAGVTVGRNKNTP